MSDRRAANYYADLADMQAAARAWREEHPTAQLKFRRLELERGTVMIAGLTHKIITRVAGNTATRELLERIDRAAKRGGATVLQAELVVAEVFGIQRALTEQLN